MLMDGYREINATGRPRGKVTMSKQEQAIVYDFLVNDITMTQASEALGMSTSSFRHFVSYVVQYWVDIGLMGFTKDVDSVNDFEDKEKQ